MLDWRIKMFEFFSLWRIKTDNFSLLKSGFWLKVKIKINKEEVKNNRKSFPSGERSEYWWRAAGEQICARHWRECVIIVLGKVSDWDRVGMRMGSDDTSMTPGSGLSPGWLRVDTNTLPLLASHLYRCLKSQSGSRLMSSCLHQMDTRLTTLSSTGREEETLAPSPGWKTSSCPSSPS